MQKAVDQTIRAILDKKVLPAERETLIQRFKKIGVTSICTRQTVENFTVPKEVIEEDLGAISERLGL